MISDPGIMRSVSRSGIHTLRSLDSDLQIINLRVSDTDEPLDLVHAEGCLRQRPTASITALPQVNNSLLRERGTTSSSGALVMTPSETPNGSRIECLIPLLGPDLEVLQSWDPILAPRIPNCTAKGQYEGYSVLLSVAQTQR